MVDNGDTNYTRPEVVVYERSKTLYKHGDFEEAIKISEEALENLSEFMYDRDIWLKRIIALANCRLKNYKISIKYFKEVLETKNECYIQREIANVYNNLNEIDLALKYSAESALNPTLNSIDQKIKTYALLERLLFKKGLKVKAKLHAELIYQIRKNDKRNIDEEEIERLKNLNIDTNKNIAHETLEKKLKQFWKLLSLKPHYSSIESIIRKVYDDFYEYNEFNIPCDLKDFTFKQNVPNYEKKSVQQFYLLKYMYSYAFEYMTMFKKILNQREFGNNIRITSFGCGNMIDYWALIRALEENDKKEISINYTGVDSIDWNYKPKARENDTINFKHIDVKKYLNEEKYLDSEIFIFPKSLGEFSGDIEHFCKNFKEKIKDNTNIYVLISYIKQDESNNKEFYNDLSDKIKDAITENKYDFVDEKVNEGNKRHIEKYFNEKYPNKIKDYLMHFKSNCKCLYKENEKCKLEYTHPQITQKYIQYKIMSFNKK
ncbi:MAG: hypothetical protein LBT10_08280 [Methanobrevibacter sp.]|jgi:hypothetical protein|nr:hypothetical protein [Methanobrevibacter sp.]